MKCKYCNNDLETGRGINDDFGEVEREYLCPNCNTKYLWSYGHWFIDTEEVDKDVWDDEDYEEC